MSAEIEAKLAGMGLSLPSECAPKGNFLPYEIENGVVFLAGQTCEWNGAMPYQGPVVAPGQTPPAGAHIDLDTGVKAAQVCALNLLFHLRDACGGDLGRVKSVIRLGGFVNCLSGFDRSPYVVNGASDLLIELFGQKGRHARTAVGVAGLPGNASVEVDAIVAID